MFGLLKTWQSESPQKRLHAIKKMNINDVANQKILFNLAYSDPEKDVRHTAINRLKDPSSLLKISQSHSNDETRSTAELTLHQLLREKDAFTETQFRELCSNHVELKPSIAMCCPFLEVRHDIVTSLNQSEQARIIADIEYSDTRQVIAEQLTKVDALEKARKLLKGKDKRAEKIIRTKLQEHHATQQQQQENFEQAQVICEKMEYIANHRSHPDFQAMFNIWSQRWQALTFIPDDTLNVRYQTAFEQVEKAISAQVKHNALIENQQLLLNDLKKYCQKIAAFSWQALCAESSQINDTIEQSETIWSELITASLMESTALHNEFMQMQNALSSLAPLCDPELEQTEDAHLSELEKMIKAVNWPNSLPPLQALTDASLKRDKLKATEKQNKQEHAAKVDQLHKRMNRLLGSTQRGNIGQAKRELSAITKAVASINGKDKAILEERLQKANEVVGKMGDWKDFATEPKFLSLCDSMEKLIDTKLHPDALAAKISALQKQWKALGYADCADEHWERFKTAADKAYEPCAVFFAQRHEIRQKNLEKREPLVTQMQALSENTDWDNVTDYQAIESQLNNILHAWRKIKDVERAAGQEQWDRLSVFKSTIYEKLDVVYDENIEAKNLLIKQANTLLESDASDDMFNKLKLFQTRWKQIGITRRKQDKIAWQDFKKTTDAVYEKIQSTRKEKRSEDDAHLQGYREIIQEIRQLGKSKISLIEADKVFDQLKADYESLPALPKHLTEKLGERLEGDLKKAIDSYSSARIDLQTAEYQQAMDVLKKKAQLCTELEASTSDKDIERLMTLINADDIPDADLKRRFNVRLNNVQHTDRTQANKARQSLCLDLEILLDVESPSEDKALRMQVQLDRMKNKGLGHAKNKDAALKELKIDWLCLPGANPKLQKSLEQRFQKALKESVSVK